jgi:hypothetical protein
MSDPTNKPEGVQTQERKHHNTIMGPSGYYTPWAKVVHAVLDEVAKERERQEAKFGEQSHPSFDPVLMKREGGCTPERMAQKYEMPTADRARFACQEAFRKGEGTYAHIAVEEFAEAICSLDEIDLRKELVQVAAVCVAWIQAIDRRGGK